MSDVRVAIRPYFSGPDKGEGGIRRWVEAQRSMLPLYGIDVVDDFEQADVIACHAGDLVKTDKPLVAHCHGLYNTAAQSWSRWEWQMNANVIEVLRRSEIATVPSQWVAMQVARGMSINARVLYAGIEPGLWEPGTNGHYVLWNKSRTDAVCDPAALNRLARLRPKQRFVSTFGDKLPNMQLTGRVPWETMRDMVQNAEVYLSTSRETFGIGTCEALACGVPVLGWDFGGNRDIVRHKQTGYLARVGDYDDLQTGLDYCIEHRAELGTAGREDVLARFTWDRAIEECAGIYRDAATRYQGAPRVSVVVTCYKLEQYLPDCLHSLQRQTMKDWECIVVDDCSPDGCEMVTETARAGDPRIRYTRTPHNLYLAGARNWGIAQAKGRYIIPLDADDMLNERALEVLADFLDKEQGVAIAYGGFELQEPDGRRWISGWPQQFSWELQMAHRNQLMYASMFRRWVWERSGGYHERCKTTEDADYWCCVTSYGARAHKVSTYPTLLYRNRPDSMSRVEQEPDWTAWYPWARNRAMTPFGAVGTPANKMSWPVPTYAEPALSIIIPVGPGHQSVVRDALDSVAAQTRPDWECIVVNDSGHALNLGGYPWARVYDTPHPGSGPAVARNIGLDHAEAPLVAFLDGDDYLMPTFAETMLAAQAKHDGYVYCDWFQIGKDGAHETKQARDYDMMALLEVGFFHAITGVYPRDAARFDPDAGGWEDWDYVFSLATQQICGTRVPEPLFCYRYWSGERREAGYAAKDKNSAHLRRKWAEYTKNGGRKLMACRGCGRGGGRKAAPMPTVTSVQKAAVAQAQDSGLVLMEFVGVGAGTRSYRGPRSGQQYRFGSDPGHKRKFVYGVDVPGLSQLRELRVVTEVDESKPEEEVAEMELLPVRQAENRIAEVLAPVEPVPTVQQDEVATVAEVADAITTQTPPDRATAKTRRSKAAARKAETAAVGAGK